LPVCSCFERIQHDDHQFILTFALLNFKKMKITRYIIPAVVVSAFLFSMCDYIVDPNEVAQTGPTFDTTKRVAIVEEWTGHTCIACPAAARDIEQMEAAYGQRFVAISIHDGYFAEPCTSPTAAPYFHPVPNCATNPTTDFHEDFLCATGASYTATHPAGPASPPQGMVNRLGMASGTEVKTRGVWSALVDSIVQKDACTSIHIDPQYNSSNREVNITVRGTWLQSYAGTINIAIMLTESGMVGWQTDGTDCDSEFVFENVLRECLNTPGSIVGTQLTTGTTPVGTAWSYTLPTAYVLPNAFDAAGCNLVAILYDTTTGEVLQAWKEKLQ
jgi:hypothetical protein